MQKRAIFVPLLLILAGLGGVLTITSTTRELQPQSSAVVQNRAWANVISYIANEGVLLDTQDKKVVIDGMFRHLRGYPRPSEAVRADIENARGAFAAVHLVLATHYHADHFDAVTVGAHLAANPKATLVAPRQVIEALASGLAGNSQYASRVLEVTPDFGQRRNLRVANIGLSVLRLHHGDTMNVGFLLTIDGKRVLHVGDSDGTVANFDAFDLQKEGIDIALVPYWYALDAESRSVIREHIAPRQVIFFHIPEDHPDHPQLKTHMQEMGGRAGLVARIKNEFPQAMFLLAPGAPSSH